MGHTLKGYHHTRLGCTSGTSRPMHHLLYHAMLGKAGAFL